MENKQSGAGYQTDEYRLQAPQLHHLQQSRCTVSIVTIIHISYLNTEEIKGRSNHCMNEICKLFTEQIFLNFSFPGAITDSTNGIRPLQ
jgi:hypothetical protein